MSERRRGHRAIHVAHTQRVHTRKYLSAGKVRAIKKKKKKRRKQ